MINTQKLGLTLIALSIVCAVALQVATEDFVRISFPQESRSDFEIIFPEKSQMKGSAGVATFQIRICVDWRYAVPVLLCAAAGFVCALRIPSKQV